VALYRDSAVGLRTYKLGEADRIVVLMTRAHGKVRAVARGVRRTGSKFGSRMEPGSVVQVQLYEGRGELDGVSQVETSETHPRTRSDLSRLGHAAALLEAIDMVAQEREPNARLHDMLVGGLASVEESNPPAVVAGFYLKLLAAEGVAPELGVCSVCGESPERLMWAPETGALRCASCGGGRVVTDETLTLSRAVLGGGLKAVLELPAGPVVHDLEAFASGLLEHHIERRLRAIRVLHDS
jgi:DNA repair protein RecO (recombination protein O)